MNVDEKRGAFIKLKRFTPKNVKCLVYEIIQIRVSFGKICTGKYMACPGVCCQRQQCYKYLIHLERFSFKNMKFADLPCRKQWCAEHLIPLREKCLSSTLILSAFNFIILHPDNADQVRYYKILKKILPICRKCTQILKKSMQKNNIGIWYNIGK